MTPEQLASVIEEMYRLPADSPQVKTACQRAITLVELGPEVLVTALILGVAGQEPKSIPGQPFEENHEPESPDASSAAAGSNEDENQQTTPAGHSFDNPPQGSLSQDA